MKRKELCERLFGRTNSSGPPHQLSTAHQEDAPLLPYSEYRAIASIGPVNSADDNASSGFDDDQDLATSLTLHLQNLSNKSEQCTELS